MALKSYSILKKKKSRKKKKPAKDLVTGGVTALVGTALLAETASIIRRI